jgi:competence transcription factor ComK
MWIQLSVLFYPDDYDPNDEFTFKTKVKLKPGTMTINHNQICSFHEMDNGNIMIHMSNGDFIQSPVKLSSFADVIEKNESKMDLVISNKN